MCLEQALQIQALLRQKYCPYELVYSNAGYKRCSVRCEGTTMISPGYNLNGPSCVGYTINFNNIATASSSLKSFICDISNCIFEEITFQCTFIKNNTGVKSNKTSSNDRDLQHQQNTCAVIGLSCVVFGGTLGVCVFASVKQIRTRQRRLKKPDADDCCEGPAERTLMIADQAAIGIKTMVDKATQVSYYKKKRSSEPRLLENKLYQIYHMEGQPAAESYGSVLFSSDFIQES